MAISPFVLHVAQIRRAAGTRNQVSCRGPIDDLVCVGSSVPPGEDVVVDVTLESVMSGDAVAISAFGTVSAPWIGECRRCLEPISGVLNARVRELYGEHGDSEEIYPLVGDLLDLEPLARDAMLLELPAAPVCRQDCHGICVTCGTNRNEETCDCSPQLDDRWAALDILRNSEGQVG